MEPTTQRVEPVGMDTTNAYGNAPPQGQQDLRDGLATVRNWITAELRKPVITVDAILLVSIEGDNTAVTVGYKTPHHAHQALDALVTRLTKE